MSSSTSLAIPTTFPQPSSKPPPTASSRTCSGGGCSQSVTTISGIHGHTNSRWPFAKRSNVSSCMAVRWSRCTPARSVSTTGRAGEICSEPSGIGTVRSILRLVQCRFVWCPPTRVLPQTGRQPLDGRQRVARSVVRVSRSRSFGGLLDYEPLTRCTCSYDVRPDARPLAFARPLGDPRSIRFFAPVGRPRCGCDVRRRS